MTIAMDLYEGDNFISVTFPYSASDVATIKRVPGARFNNRNEELGPHWRVPKDMETCYLLRDLFGTRLTMSSAVRNWAKAKKRQHEQLTDLALGDTAELESLHQKLPDLYDAIHLGPVGRQMSQEERIAALEGSPASFQAADVKFMATATCPMNCNQPGLGKTLETIAAVFEGGHESGPKLVVAPLSSLETVWGDHLRTWQHQPTLVAPADRKGRETTVAKAMDMTAQGEDFWLVINPAMIQYRREYKRCEEHSVGKPKKSEMRDCFSGCEEVLVAMFPELLDIHWNVVILDEFHKMGLGNPNTLTYKAMRDIKVNKRMALSGTPMGGKPIKMYGALSFLYPEEFTSKWRFADQWLQVDSNGFGKNIGGIRQDKEEDFYRMLSRYMIRRTKAECLPWLPPKQYIELTLPMSPEQAKQYEIFAAEAEIRIDEEKLTATSILAEYTRLKQFATAKQEVLGRDEEGRLLLRPTADGNKLPYAIDLLEERGVRPGEDNEGEEQVVIFSQFSSVIDMVTDELRAKGYPVDKLTGDVPAKRREELQREFQEEGGLRVLCMTTTAGGTAITLDRASTVIFMDETWDPDDQEQAEDRCHRASRLHQVTIYYLRSEGTIEQYIQEKVLDKSTINKNILDLRRQGLKALRD